MPPLIVDFRTAETFDEVAGLLGLKPASLEHIIAAGHAPDQQPIVYVRHRIPKRSTGVRTVWDIPLPLVRDAHRAFSWRFADFAGNVLNGFPHPAAYGYVRGRGIRDNAERHCGHRLLLRCDLKDFFPTITRNRLAGRFVQLGLHAQAAEILADFATIEGALALGLNASPMLANLVCSGLDEKLDKLADHHGCDYTRYADDIAFSGDSVPPTNRIAEIIEAEGFRLSAKKMRLTKLGQAHYVTGLSVSDPAAPHVPRRFKRGLRQELYYCTKFGIQGHLSRVDGDASYQRGINRLDGSVRFVSAIEPTLGERLRAQWRAVLTAESAHVSYAPVHDRAGVDATFLIDEAEFERDGQNYLALACVTTEQLDKLRTICTSTLREYLIDPFAPGRKGPLAKKGLHLSDAPEALRTDFIAQLRFLQFRGYLAFGHLPDNESYVPLYATLLGALLPRRLKNYDRARVTVEFEENPRLVTSELERIVGNAYGDLEKHNERRPIVSPKAIGLTKQQERAFAVPDCLLWVFARAFAAEKRTDQDFLRFERLRDKYRHIVNIDTGEIFSRRHPIEIPRPTGKDSHDPVRSDELPAH